MKVGDTFSSYEEFSKKLTKYKKLVHNEYWVRDSKTIENQRKRYPDTVQNANECLKYYYLVVACIRGGRKFVPKHGNSTRNCSTSKQDCSAAIHIHMSKCKKYLAVTRLNECHNHKTSAAYFNSLSQQRLKLPVEVKKDISELLETGANKKLILEKVHTRTGCRLKDLSKINRRKKKKNLVKNLNNHQKFKMMDEQCKIMSQMCSEVSTPVFYERLNFIKSIIHKWREGEFKLRNVSEYSNNNLTEENIECLPLLTPDAGSCENECNPSISDAESAISDSLDELKKINLKNIKMPLRILKRGRPKGLRNRNRKISDAESAILDPHDELKKINLKNIKMPRKILKRGQPKGLGNTIIGLKRGKRNSNTKTRLENAENNHKEDNMESTFEKILENTKEGFTENNFYLDKRQEKCSSESLNEDHLVMEEEYLDEEFLEQL